MFNGLREGTDPAQLGPLGAVLPQLMPMLLRQFNNVPEPKLRATIAALCARLTAVIAEDGPAVIEPFRPDVSRETSATLVPPPYAQAYAGVAAELGLELLDESAPCGCIRPDEDCPNCRPVRRPDADA